MKSERRTLVGGLTLAAALALSRIVFAQVAASNGRVKLSGQVGSKAAAEHAQQVVAQIDGVKSVDNELKTKSE
jgi:osmotically-inducible protein OsmY